MSVRVLRCADSGVLVEVGGLGRVLALYAALRADPPDGVTDLVPAARTLLLSLDPARADPDAVARAVRAAAGRAGTEAAPGEVFADAPPVRIPVAYDGADLDDVAAHTGLTPREVVAAHTGTPWTVAFCGFSPGFGYLAGGDPCLRVPRRAESRTRVPAGAVALAGEFSGVYPRESPGGWQLVGRTEVATWDLDRDPPALLRPGVRVRFEEAG
ncbi:MAG TPA: allophanate hydrolase subunit 1 [Streptosporangiaceae bacterium]